MTVRQMAIKAARILPDSLYIRFQYHSILGNWPDLKNPKTFNEKMQWLKLHDRKPEFTMMADKYLVKDYIARTIGEQYVIPTYGVWGRVEDIEYDKLPERFVLKCTHDSGSVIVCRDKKTFNAVEASKKLTASMKKNGYWYGREWPYKDIPHRIIAEQYLDDPTSETIRDYKFFCFNGEPKFVYLSEGLENHSNAHIAFYDFDGNEMPFHRDDYKRFDVNPVMPTNTEEMRQLSEKLAKKIPCPFVRTDFYSINGKTYFSEITFTPCSGLMPLTPREWDATIGSWLNLVELEDNKGNS